MGKWKVCHAEASNVVAICRIHNEGIEERIATLDLELHTLETKIEKFANPGNP